MKANLNNLKTLAPSRTRLWAASCPQLRLSDRGSSRLGRASPGRGRPLPRRCRGAGGRGWARGGGSRIRSEYPNCRSGCRTDGGLECLLEVSISKRKPVAIRTAGDAYEQADQPAARRDLGSGYALGRVGPPGRPAPRPAPRPASRPAWRRPPWKVTVRALTVFIKLDTCVFSREVGVLFPVVFTPHKL